MLVGWAGPGTFSCLQSETAHQHAIQHAGKHAKEAMGGRHWDGLHLAPAAHVAVELHHRTPPQHLPHFKPSILTLYKAITYNLIITFLKTYNL